MSKKSTLTTKFDKFDSSRLTFTEFEENERSKGQMISYPRYNHPTLGEGTALFLQGPWMVISTYGIPSLGEYYADDSQRAFMKIPLDDKNPEVVQMVNEFKKLDEELGSEEFMQKSFGKKASKYKYQPIIRASLEDEEGNVKPAYMKLKLDTSWPDGNVKTELYKSEMVNNKRARELVTATTVTEVTKYLRYMTKYKPIFRPVKMWAHNSKMPKPEYGVVFKLLKVEFEPSASGENSYSDYMTGDAFIDDEEEEEETKEVKEDSDEEEEEEVVKPPPAPTKKQMKKAEKEVVEDSDEDESSSDESDESDSDEPPKKSASKTTTKGKTKAAKSKA